MKNILYVTFVLLLLFSGCTSHKICKKFPEAFINAYLPYQLNQKVSFCCNKDTIDFIIDALKIPYDVTLEINNNLFCTKCGEPTCPSAGLHMKGTNISGTFSYGIGLPLPDETIQIYTEILVIDSKNNHYTGHMGENFQTTPFDEKVFDILGDTINLFDNREENQFCQVDIIKNKGIYAFYEKMENGDTRKWELVE